MKRRKKLSPSFVRALFLVSLSFILYSLLSVEISYQREAGVSAYGIKLYACEFISFENRGDDTSIQLLNTPLLKKTSIRLGGEKSVARLCPFSDCFFVQQYKENSTGNLSLYKTSSILRASVKSDFYSPLLNGENFKCEFHVFTDYGTYVISSL